VQLEYANEVASAFSQSTHRVIEAGTGVGKSISYLLPAVLFAKRNKAQFGVATKTNSLLDQLACNEIPRLSQVYFEKYGEEISSVEIKGFDHYPCLRKLWRYRNATDIDDVRELDAVAMVISSVAQSVWMDLDDLSIAWRKGVMRHITCSSEECLKSHCRFFPNECYVRGLRRRAANADVMLTNHSFLFRDITNPRGISRQIKHWIVDEAHCVEDEARSQLSFKFKESDLKYATGELAAPSKGILRTVEKLAMADSDFNNLESASKFLLTLSHAMQDCEELNPLLSEMIAQLIEVIEIESSDDKQKKYRNENIWFSAEHREKPQFAALENAAGELLAKLNSLVLALRNIITGVEKLESATQITTELSAMTDRLHEMMTSISYFIAGEEENLFYSVEIKGYTNKFDITMNSCMFNVGEALAEIFYPEMSSIIFTSATIAVADSFDYFCSLIGLDRVNNELWSVKQLQSSYDFDNNMEVLLASDIGDPRSPNYIEDMAKLLSGLILKLGGGVLALFTNRAEMQKVHAIVKEKLANSPELKLLTQHSSISRRRLQEDFVQNESASLFALKSFWEGFDAPGSTLRCVVIVKIPFSRPDEPLSRERETRESNAWSRYTLPQAIIETKQAAGRLIRSHTDEGYLIFGDSRLLTKHYGKKVIASMPSNNVKTLDVESIIDGVS
jgi:ATP-dependent DNA helicase DinG